MPASINVNVFLAETERGTILAATKETPYFCLEAETEEAVLDKVRAALRFHFLKRTTPTARPANRPVITPFLASRVIRSSDLNENAA